MDGIALKSSSKFLRVKCNDCGHEQVVFGKAATPVKCQKCSKDLLMTTGGKSDLIAKVVKVLD